MKQVIVFGIVATSIVLTGCGNKTDENVTVIGGADEPTSILPLKRRKLLQ